jgi:hypothetical protein
MNIQYSLEELGISKNDFEDRNHFDYLIRSIDNLLRFLHMKMEYYQLRSYVRQTNRQEW